VICTFVIVLTNKRPFRFTQIIDIQPGEPENVIVFNVCGVLSTLAMERKV